MYKRQVEESIQRILYAYGTKNADVFAIPSCIIVSINDQSNEAITKVRRLYTRDTNFDKVEQTNDLCRRICAEKPEYAWIKSELHRIDAVSYTHLDVYKRQGRGNADTGETTWRTTFGKLDENAKQLIITPSFRFFSSSGGGVAIGDDGSETPVETYTIEREPRTVVLDEVVVDLQ